MCGCGLHSIHCTAEIPACPCLLRHCSQQRNLRIHVGVHQQEWREKLRWRRNRILFMSKGTGSYVLSREMGTTRDECVNQIKSNSGREIFHVFSHLWKLYQSHTCNRVCVAQKWKHVCRTTQRLTKGEVRDTEKTRPKNIIHIYEHFLIQPSNVYNENMPIKILTITVCKRTAERQKM